MKRDCNVFAFLLIASLLIFSCKEPESQNQTERQQVLGITGNFYTLQCPKANFDKLTKPSNGPGDPRGNVVFKYYILNGTFTLNGWVINGANPNNYVFDASPFVYFTPTTLQSGEKYGDSTYLGDFLLDKFKVDTIKQALVNRGHDFVIFRPKRISPENLIWEVGTLDSASLGKDNLFDPVLNAYLDPIPPKRYDRLQN